jgi:hypothetical protein
VQNDKFNALLGVLSTKSSNKYNNNRGNVRLYVKYNVMCFMRRDATRTNAGTNPNVCCKLTTVLITHCINHSTRSFYFYKYMLYGICF